MIALEHVTKHFAGRPALQDVSFQVEKNQLCGFVGPNGAGKTTAMRIIAGYISADEGHVTVNGLDVATSRGQSSEHIGYLPQAAPAYPEMRVRDYLRFRANVKGLGRGSASKAIDSAIEQAGLGDCQKRVIGRLSHGYRQRVGIADTLLGAPSVLLLDEPAVGLDPVQNSEFRELLQLLRRERTVLLSSHVLSEIETLADQIVMLRDGRVVGDGSLDTLRTVTALPDTASLEDVFAKLAGRHAAAPSNLH